jgi:UDP-galactose transporter B1
MLKLVVCVVGIYACFLTWGVTQERVTSATLPSGEKFRYFVVLNTVQAAIAALIGGLYVQLSFSSSSKLKSKLDKPSPNWFRISVIALLATLASPFGYASLKHIDYPTMILAKSCKLVPVVLVKFFFFGKSFPRSKYLAVFLVTAGVAMFMVVHPQEGHPKSSKGIDNSSLLGIALVTLNLLLDGALNSSQDSLFTSSNITGGGLMMAMNAFSAVYMSVYLMLGPYLPGIFHSNEWTQTLQFLSQSPETAMDILIFALTGAIGQCFIFLTLESFGSIVLVTVTVTRKMFSIVLSAFWFGHVFSWLQWLSVGIVFAGLSIESFMKSSPKIQSKSIEKSAGKQKEYKIVDARKKKE